MLLGLVVLLVGMCHLVWSHVFCLKIWFTLYVLLVSLYLLPACCEYGSHGLLDGLLVVLLVCFLGWCSVLLIFLSLACLGGCSGVVPDLSAHCLI